jgi:hypothetical protein
LLRNTTSFSLTSSKKFLGKSQSSTESLINTTNFYLISISSTARQHPKSTPNFSKYLWKRVRQTKPISNIKNFKQKTVKKKLNPVIWKCGYFKSQQPLKTSLINYSTFIAIKKLSTGELLLLKIGKSEPTLRTDFTKQCRRKITEIP